MTEQDMTADEFLTKPVDRTESRTGVKTLIEKSERIRRQIGRRNRPLPSIISIIVAVIAATLSTIIFVTNEPITAKVIVEKSIEQRELSSKEELEKWLAGDDTDKKIFYFVDDKGVPRLSDQYDCDDYALQ